MSNAVLETRTKYEEGAPLEAKAIAVSAAEKADAKELLALGALAKEFSDFETANAAYEQLVNADPDNPDFRNLYAMTLIQSGEFKDAETHLNAALSTHEGHAHSYFNLSMIHRADAGDKLIAQLEDRLSAPNVTPGDNYAYRMALGKFYDDAGDFDNAFLHFENAKQSARIPYDHAAQQAFFDRLKTAYSSDLIKSNAGVGDPNPAALFIVGMPRSGSSLLESMLGQDARVQSLGERIELTLVIEALTKRKESKGGYLRLLPDLTSEEFSQCGADYIKRLAPLTGDAERFTDKNVLNFLRAGFINLTLPNAAIIHARRDPIDICLSCYFQTFDPSIFPFTFKLADIGKYYALYADLMAHWDNIMPDRVSHIDYETLITEPESTVKNILKTAGLKAAPKKTASKAMVATSSAWQARQPIYETSVKRWKNYEKHLSPLFEALEESGFRSDAE